MVLADINWSVNARVEVNRVGLTYWSHIWQCRKERLEIEVVLI